MMKILVYPFSTEIAFEIYRSLNKIKNIEIWGGGDVGYNHGEYVFKDYITGLPFITDDSVETDVKEFQKLIEPYGFDFIFPAMDSVVYKFSQFRDQLKPILIAPESRTAFITRSKRRTYEVLKDVINTPKQYLIGNIPFFPVFIKPDIGQGSLGAKKINSIKELNEFYKDGMLILEYLPGEEYTVDCFTNLEGKLISVCARKRNRMKNGISINSSVFVDPKINVIAEKINSKIHNRGGWFFQIKKNSEGEYFLLEVASRIAGSSSLTRCLGINLPLLTVLTYAGENIDLVPQIEWEGIILDRAFYNAYKIKLNYDSIYTDFDDTIVINNHLNLQLITFFYQCIDEGKCIYLVSKHDDKKYTTLDELLRKYRIKDIFTGIIHIKPEDKKYRYITGKNSIYIDDSFGERDSVRKHLGIPCFDPSMIESLLNIEKII